MHALDQRIGAWCGLIFVVLFGAGLAIAGFLPLPGPSMTPEQVAAMYQHNSVRIRVGMFIMVFAAAFFFALTAVTSHQLMRIAGASRMPAYFQMIAGTANAITFFLAPVLFALTAFRPDRDHDVLYTLNDLAWFIFIVPGSAAVFQGLAIALGVFTDNSPNPVFPRWFGYLCIWFSMMVVPTILPMFFKDGPFAWNGLFGFYTGATAFFVWIISLVVLLLRAINEEERVPVQLVDTAK